MQVFKKLESFLDFRHSLPLKVSLGLVPTMGALHEGHASLVRRSVLENDHTLVTIFVNPTQFGPGEDFEQYPRDLESDTQLLTELGADIVLAPVVDEIYPKDSFIRFHIVDLASRLCARSRPGHMEGVLQIVSILFHLTQPHRAYFGEKDFQQCLLIQRLVQELHFPLKVVPCPIVRESDGLALSSRNVYLNPEERLQAVGLSQTLNALKEHGKQFPAVNELKRFAYQQLRKYPLIRIDYIEVLDGETLSPIDHIRQVSHPRAFLACFLGKTRLIDNLAL